MTRTTWMILCTLLVPGLAHAQLTIPRHTVDGGGGRASSGTFRLHATAGQPEAFRPPAANAHWNVRGGFWVPGADAATAVEGPAPLPRAFRLHTNVPNPFNPSTTIRFDVPRTSRVRVEVYNLRGERVRVLRDRVFDAGRHAAVWNGTDHRGAGIASGVYLVLVRAEGFEARQKVTLVK